MMLRPIATFLVLLMVTGAVALTALGSVFGPSKKTKHRFRLTLQFETLDGIKAASGVYEAVSWESSTPGIRRQFHSAVTGEAIFIDLGGGRNVVALMGYGQEGTDDALFEAMAVRAFQRAGLAETWEDISRA